MLQAVILGIVEGLTEFLPVSSTGHLTIVEKMLGFDVEGDGVTAFTALIQLGPILAVLLFFRRDIWAISVGWFRGLVSPRARHLPEWRFAWLVIIGSVPIGLVGFAARDALSGIRSLWIVAGALILWSFVMLYAERRANQNHGSDRLRFVDVVIIGGAQCIALVPGVSRSGATISAGLLRGLDRNAATKLSFYLAIPAMVGAGSLEAASQASAINATVGWGPTLVAGVIAFAVGWASIAWLLRLVAHHSIGVFAPYRIAVGVVLIVFLAGGLISAT